MPLKPASFALVTAPATEPVTLAEAKAQLNVTDTEQDTYITSLIAIAREAVEAFTGRAFVSQSWKAVYEDWPNDKALILPRPPLVSVSSVKYFPRTGAEVTLATDYYKVDIVASPGRICLKYDWTLPSLSFDYENPIIVAYTAGYTTVPALVKHAILLTIRHWYDNRTPVVVGTTTAVIPLSVQTLLRLLKVQYV